MTSEATRRYLRIAATPITLLFLLALIALALTFGWKGLTAPMPGDVIPPCVPTDVGKNLTTKSVSVKVVNGGYTRRLASDVGKQLTAKGFNVTATGNTDDRVKQTVIVGAAKDSPEVKLVAGFFQKADIQVDPAKVDHSVTVKVGSSYGGFNAKAPTSIAVNGAVCLPAPSASPTPTPGSSTQATPTATASSSS